VLGIDDGLELGEKEGTFVGLGLGTGESVGLEDGILVGAGVPVGAPVGVSEGLGLGTGESVGDVVGAVGAADSLGAADGGMSISNVLTPKPVSFIRPRVGPTRRDAIIQAFNIILLCISIEIQSKLNFRKSWKQRTERIETAPDKRQPRTIYLSSLFQTDH